MVTYCHNCGAEVSKEAKFCGSCGEKISVETIGSYSRQKEWKLNILMKKTVVIVMSAIAGFLATLFFESYAQIDMSPFRALIGFLLGATAGGVVVVSTKEKVSNKNVISSSGSSLFKKSLGYTIGAAVVSCCLAGFVWAILGTVSFFELEDFGNIFDFPWLLVPVVGSLPIGIAPFLFHAKYDRLGAILFIGSIVALLSGLLGAFFADMEVIEMSMAEGLGAGALIGGVLPSLGVALFTSSRRLLRTIGGCILGGVILGIVGFMYSLQRYVGPLYTFHSYIAQPSELFVIALMGIVLGVILGGILGYLDFNLGSLRNNMPQAFVAISPLLIAPIGFLIGWVYFIMVIPEGFATGSNSFEFVYVTPYGVFLLTVIWAVIGLIAGIATVILGIKQEERGIKNVRKIIDGVGKIG